MSQNEVICIGSYLWDMIGRCENVMQIGSDMPGIIHQIPGGVALNIAQTLRRFDLSPIALTAIGNDPQGDALIRFMEEKQIETTHVFRGHNFNTDRYMVIEGANGVIAAIADAHSLETAGQKILTPIMSDALSLNDRSVIIDGNLSETLLSEIALSDRFKACDLRIVPASPGKAKRLVSFFDHPSALLYVNLEEACLLCDHIFSTSAEAAKALTQKGISRAIVTHGPHPSADACEGIVLEAESPIVAVERLTGAGDTFIAAHLAAEKRGFDRQYALCHAQKLASHYVSGQNIDDFV